LSTTTTALSADEGIPVGLPSGAPFLVMTEDERDYVAERVQRYTDQLHLENVSDLAQLDLMICLEMLCHRWTLWLSRQKDYWGEDVDEVALRRSLNDYSGEIRQIKKGLGVDKVTRDRTKGSESVSQYLDELARRALSFGYMREGMLDRGIELSQQLIALLTLHDNCTDVERQEMHVTESDIIDWLRTVFVPEFQEVDLHFRTHDQRMWIRQM